MQFAYIIIIALMSMVVSCGYPLHSSLKHENLKFPQLVITPVTSPIEVRYRPDSGLIKTNAVTQDGNTSPSEATLYMLTNIEEKEGELFWLGSMTIHDPKAAKSNLPFAVINMRSTPLGKLLSSSVSFPALEGKKGKEKELDELKKAFEKIPSDFVKGISSDQVKTGDVWSETDLSEAMDELSDDLYSQGYRLDGPCMRGFKIKSIFKGLTHYKNKVAIVAEMDDFCQGNIINFKNAQLEVVDMRIKSFSILERHTLFPLFGEALISVSFARTDRNISSMYMRMESK